MPFMRSYYADHSVLYHRDDNPRQEDLGTFSSVIEPNSVSLDSTDVEVQGSKYGGYNFWSLCSCGNFYVAHRSTGATSESSD